MKKFKRVMSTAIAITALFTSSMSPVTVSAATTAKATQPKATAAVSAAKMKKNVKLTFKKTNVGVMAYVKNTNKFNVEVHAEITFKNSKGKKINSTTDRNYCLEKGKTCIFDFTCYSPSTYKNVPFSKYSYTYTVEASTNKLSYVSKISAKLASKDNYCYKFNVKNNSKKNLSFIHLTAVWFDKKGKVIGVDDTFASCEKKNSQKTSYLYYPYDSKKSTYIKPAKCKLYVDYAYMYK